MGQRNVYGDISPVNKRTSILKGFYDGTCNAYACEQLAFCYESGKGVKKSRSKYVHYLKHAAEHGSHTAKLFLEIDQSQRFWKRRRL